MVKKNIFENSLKKETLIKYLKYKPYMETQIEKWKIEV